MDIQKQTREGSTDRDSLAYRTDIMQQYMKQR
jgi:hypothetical protein